MIAVEVVYVEQGTEVQAEVIYSSSLGQVFDLAILRTHTPPAFHVPVTVASPHTGRFVVQSRSTVLGSSDNLVEYHAFVCHG